MIKFNLNTISLKLNKEDGNINLENICHKTYSSNGCVAV